MTKYGLRLLELWRESIEGRAEKFYPNLGYAHGLRTIGAVRMLLVTFRDNVIHAEPAPENAAELYWHRVKAVRAHMAKRLARLKR